MEEKLIKLLVKAPWKRIIKNLFTLDNVKKLEKSTKLVSLAASALVVIMKKI